MPLRGGSAVSQEAPADLYQHSLRVNHADLHHLTRSILCSIRMQLHLAVPCCSTPSVWIVLLQTTCSVGQSFLCAA